MTPTFEEHPQHAWAVVGWMSVCALVSACSSPPEDSLFTEEELAVIATLSPLPEKPLPEPTNQHADDPRAAILGQMLFSDKQLSGPLMMSSSLGEKGESGKLACATCHVPEGWFQDIRGHRTSVGVHHTKRNTLTLVNDAFNPWPYWNGRIDSYWGQALGAIRHDLNGDVLRIVHLVFGKYRNEYEAAFSPLDPALDPASAAAARFPPAGSPKMEPADPDGPWDAMAKDDQMIAMRIFSNLGKSIQAYTRQLISRDAPFDRFVAGDKTAINSSAKRGLKLFIGKAACKECHEGPTFSDNKFHNVGISQKGDPDHGVPEIDLGRRQGIEQTLNHMFNTSSMWSDKRDTGKLDGLMATEEHEGKFRTQPLRHVADTPPYMHAGQFETLRDVVKIYNEGGAMSGFVGTKDEKIEKLNLSETEIDDLVAFLKTLTGKPLAPHLLANTAK